MKKSLLLGAMVAIAATSVAQKKDKATFEEVKPGYYQNSILKGIDDYEGAVEEEATVMRMKVDFSDWDIPTDPASYTQVWHNNPISQGNTGTCWCFSTTSFYESEVKRTSGKEVKLSEMWVVYWEYVERAIYFVDNRGAMHLGEGSETNAVARMLKKHGAMPWDHFNGLKEGQTFHNHEQMFVELENYLASVKESNAWNKDEVVATTKAILEHYVGKVPTEVKIDGKTMTPHEYLNDVLKLDMDGYVDFMSLMEKPYNTKQEYDVPDNWWQSAEYYNVDLDVFMGAVKDAIDKGYTMSIGGDVSEPGFDKITQAGVIPTWDIPSEYIDDAARQMRFNDGSTTDDHAMHLVGHKEVSGKTWFLIKDSSSGSRNCGPTCDKFGYYFVHEDFVKLKWMSFTVHKDAVKSILKKIKA